MTADTRRAVPWIVLALVLAGTALMLRMQGRLWICSCKYVLLWSGDIHSAGNSQHLFDPYAFTHVLHGFIFLGIVSLIAPLAARELQLIGATILEAVWEIIENSTFIIERYRNETISLGYTGDTIVNSAGDVVACAAGVLLAQRLGLKWTLLLFVLIEGVLTFWIRDSLMLNILMLLYPMDSIRAWQSP